MSSMTIDDLFYGKPERVRYVAGGVGYGSHEFGHGHQQRVDAYQAGPHYYSDGDDYYSQRHIRGRAPVYHSSGTARPMLPDVQLSVPMDSQRCVHKVKEALDISGVYSVHCCVPSQTVTVSGNVAPQALLKRVKHVKRKSKILSYSGLYSNTGNVGGGSSSYGSSNYFRSGQMHSPQVDHSYYSRNNLQHTFARPSGYVDHYRPSHEHHHSSYY